MVQEILEGNLSSDFFVIKSLRAADDLDNDRVIEKFLRGVLLDDFSTGKLLNSSNSNETVLIAHRALFRRSSS